MIELLLRQRVDLDRFEIASAGTRGWKHAPMDSMAAMEALRLGADPARFRSHPVDNYLVDSADLVLVATREHRAAVLEINPQALRRTFTLLEFASLAELVDAEDLDELVKRAALIRSQGPAQVDIGDPYRRAPEVHRATAEQILVAVESISTILNRIAHCAPARIE